MRVRIPGGAALMAIAGLLLSGPVHRIQPAAAAPRAFRVCADPNNMPFSSSRRDGFENRIAELLAHDLRLPVEYAWLPQGRGFIRKTLNAGLCDVVMGVPRDYDMVRTTHPYFRSTYAFVFRAASPYAVRTMDDSVLRRLRIGIHVIGDDYQNTPPAEALAARGIIDNVVGFPIFGDYGKPDPAAAIIHAVARDSIDVAIVWGPFAGYFATREHVPLTVVPLEHAVDASGQPFAYDISLGVRHADSAFAVLLDSLLVRDRAAITGILRTYGVPLLPVTATRSAAGHEHLTVPVAHSSSTHE
jgi:quinoprotein dehydrogenase-associated probable ABC transporter substrate-binding protein